MRLRRGLFLCLVCFLSVGGVSTGQTVGFIDSRLLLLAHPVFRTLDPETRRFAGISAPSSHLDLEIRQAESALAALHTRLNTASGSFRVSYASARTPQDRRKAEESFWNERNSIQKDIESARARLQVLKQSTKTKSGAGVTPADSLLPSILDIQQDIVSVVNQLAASRKLRAVLDSAALAPFALPPAPEESVLHTTLQRDFFYGDPGRFNSAQFNAWLEQARRYWHIRLPDSCSRPFHGGAADLRAESVKALLEKHASDRRTRP